MTGDERALLWNIYYEAFCDACNPVNVGAGDVAGGLSTDRVRRAVNDLRCGGYLRRDGGGDGLVVFLTEKAVDEMDTDRTRSHGEREPERAAVEESSWKKAPA